VRVVEDVLGFDHSNAFTIRRNLAAFLVRACAGTCKEEDVMVDAPTWVLRGMWDHKHNFVLR
jgi:hypothetical protein